MKERQVEIIEASGRILTASGVKGLTIKNLAKEMQFSESAIYRHFTSKEAIVVEMLNYLAESMDKRLAKSVQNDGTAGEKLEELFKSQFIFFKKHPHFVVAAFSDGLMEESGRINEAILKIMGVKMKYLMPLILEGQQKGVFTSAITTEALVDIALGTFRLQMFKWRVSNFEFDIVKVGTKMIQSLLELIGNKQK